MVTLQATNEITGFSVYLRVNSSQSMKVRSIRQILSIISLLNHMETFLQSLRKAASVDFKHQQVCAAAGVCIHGVCVWEREWGCILARQRSREHVFAFVAHCQREWYDSWQAAWGSTTCVSAAPERAPSHWPLVCFCVLPWRCHQICAAWAHTASNETPQREEHLKQTCWCLKPAELCLWGR